MIQREIETGNAPASTEFLIGGGETGDLIRSIDWSKTVVGPPACWPPSLRTSVTTALRTRFPILIWWGSDLTLIYNDAYIPIFAGKHPSAMGKPGLSLAGWGEDEVKVVIEPMLRGVLETGKPTWSEDQLLVLERKGFAEEAYFTWSYSPIVVESGDIGGVLTIVTETSGQVLSQRRMNILRDLGEKILDAKNLQEAFRNVVSVLDSHPLDLPFFLLYQAEEDSGELKLRGRSGMPLDSAICPENIDISGDDASVWPVGRVFRHSREEVMHDLEQKAGPVRGYWPEACATAYLLPIIGAGQKAPFGVLICGISPRLEFDADYKSFIKLLTDQIATSISNVLTIEEERRRAQALAEIDRAKTTFFSNISHEFRTPLTLMLSPLEATMESGDNLTERQKKDLDVSLRNTLRLQKLVNTLLDFSRIEAGKMAATFEYVDLGRFTEDLASTFRSAIESAGIRYDVSVRPAKATAMVDVDMWEKVVLNLISNAFKYTREGRVSVALAEEDDRLVLRVSDTGVGIRAEDQEKIFERFYRVNNAGGRSQEGTGIGLSMVKELVNLHKGEIHVDSVFGKGSTFTVSLPVVSGAAHAPLVTVRRNRMRNAFIEEAMKWVDPASVQSPDPALAGAEMTDRPKILLADDNGDMRDYMQRLLQDKFDIRAVTNGEDAFSLAISWQPELILTDIMMPRLDGFGLLKKLKSTLATRNVPVVFLSARAGEESRVEGITAGADDYLTKPFSARELIARVTNHILISRTRRATEKQFYNLFLQAPAHINVMKGPDHVLEFFHPMGIKLIGRDITGMKVREALPEVEGQGYFEMLDQVYHEGKSFHLNETRAVLRTESGELEEMFMNNTYLPWRDIEGNIQGVLQFAFDVTKQVQASKVIRESEARFRVLATSIPQIIWIAGPGGEIEYLSDQWEKYTGMSPLGGRGKFNDLVHEEDRPVVESRWKTAVETGEPWQAEFRLKDTRNGTYRWFSGNSLPLKDEEGKVAKWIGSSSDIHSQKLVEERLKGLTEELESVVSARTAQLKEVNEMLLSKNSELLRSNSDLQQFAHVTSHDLKEPVRKIKMYNNLMKSTFDTLLPDKGKTFIEKIENASSRISAMIDGVLQYSIIDSVQQSGSEIDLDAIFRDIADDLEILIHEKQAQLNVSPLPVIHGSPTLIYQLFYNLLNNSLKFINGKRKPVIEISACTVGGSDTGISEAVKGQDYVRVDVRDNGIGFDQAYAETIFESFSRLNPKDKYEGTGLGLALCKKIVQRHNGFIRAAGKSGEGSTFSVFLPAGS